MAKVRIAVFIFFDVLIFVAVGLVALFMRTYLTPFKRGFFINDESIMYPFRPSTITNVTLYVVGLTLPVITVIIIEIFRLHRSKCNGQSKEAQSGLKCFISVCHIIAVFFFGAVSTHLLTDIPKYTIGRLRPHFFDVCRPNVTLLNETSGYIQEDICTGDDAHLIKEARLSFPSGHSSISMYCAFFLIVSALLYLSLKLMDVGLILFFMVSLLYLESKFTWRGVPLLRPLIQLVAFGMAFYTCLSRVSDNKHHWSDVLAGGLLGTAMAFICFRYVKMSRRLWYNGSSTP